VAHVTGNGTGCAGPSRSFLGYLGGGSEERPGNDGGKGSLGFTAAVSMFGIFWHIPGVEH